MKLYGVPSSRTRRALWALEEAGAEFEFERVDIAKGAGRDPDYLSLNPSGKVPTLVDGDLVLSESGAICNYIAAAFPDAMLAPPAGTAERAKCDQWMFFAVSELEQPLWTMGKHRFVLPPGKRVPDIVETADYEWTIAADVLALGLAENDYIVWDRFTIADIMLAHTLFWARGFDVPLGHDPLERYMDRMLARPAFKRTMEPGRY